MSENLNEKQAAPLVISIPAEIAHLAPDLQRFFDAMVYKLRRNKSKGRWEDKSLDDAFTLMEGEVVELRQAIAGGSTMEIVMEAADIANFAMITANVALERKANV